MDTEVEFEEEEPPTTVAAVEFVDGGRGWSDGSGGGTIGDAFDGKDGCPYDACDEEAVESVTGSKPHDPTVGPAGEAHFLTIDEDEDEDKEDIDDSDEDEGDEPEVGDGINDDPVHPPCPTCVWCPLLTFMAPLIGIWVDEP